MKTKDLIKYILSGALAVFLLWFSFRNVDWTDFWAGLKACSWGFVLLSMLIGVMSFFVRSLRWKMLLDPLDNSIKLGPVFNAINISYLVNLVIPRGGDVLRCAYIAKHSQPGEDGHKKASFDKVLGTAVVDRVWDFVTLVILFVAIVLIMWHRFGTFVSDNILGSLSSKRNTVIILAAVGVVGILCLWALWRFKDKNRIAGKVWGFFKGLGDGLTTCLKMKNGWLFLVYTILVWTCYCFMSATVIWAVQGMDPSVLGQESVEGITSLQSLGLVDALFLCLVGAISNTIPVPGGFGAFHWLVSMALLVIYGVPFEIGIIFATISHESQALTQALCGGVSYLLEMKQTT